MLQLTQVLLARMSEGLPKSADDVFPEEYVKARDDAFGAIKEALVLSQRMGDAGIRASALFWRSELLVWSFKRTEALDSAKEAMNTFESIKDEKGRAHAQVLMADVYLASGQNEEAKEYAEEVLNFAQSSPETLDLQKSAQGVLDRLAAKSRQARGRPGGRTKIVRQKVKKWRKKDGSGGGGAAASMKMDVAAVSAKVVNLVRNVLTDDEDIEQDVPFMEAGVDSLGSVQLVTDVGKEFKMALAPSVVFDFPSIRALSDHLAVELSSAAPASGGGGGDDEWEEYEDWEDVEVPDDGYDDYEIVPVQSTAAVAQDTAAVASVAAPSTPKGLELKMVLAKVTDLVKSVITDDDDIAEDTPFMEAGVDSLGSVQLVTDVGKAFSMALAPSIVFDFPSIRTLSDHLVAESMG
jgi:acyl carrier protein